MTDYTLIRRLLTAEQKRRAEHYRYRPRQRAGKMAEIAGALAALDRLAGRAQPQPLAGSPPAYWQDKFD